jgi:predicted esterase
MDALSEDTWPQMAAMYPDDSYLVTVPWHFASAETGAVSGRPVPVPPHRGCRGGDPGDTIPSLRRRPACGPSAAIRASGDRFSLRTCWGTDGRCRTARMLWGAAVSKTVVIAAVVSSALALGGWNADQAAPPDFSYDRAKSFELKVSRVEMRGRVKVEDVSHARLDGSRNLAFVVTPPAGPAGPGILFVHWLEDASPTSNRTEFLDEAVELAATDGVTSFLPDAMWSVPDWFRKRNPADDFRSSVVQVKEISRALDLLVSRPGVDAKRLLFVGHDFGAMYGAVSAGLDPGRLRGFVFMAGTQSFSDWFLLYPKVAGEVRQQVIDRLAPIDPTRSLARMGSVPVLFQFGTKDRFVSRESADALVAAAAGPKTSYVYDAEHSLTSPPKIRADRLSWIRARLSTREP